jgi:hypothetical protein
MADLLFGLSMVVDDLDMLRPLLRPVEADPPLIVDANAVLSGPVSLQELQSVSRR